MIFTPLLKPLAALSFALFMSPESYAQATNWYQQYTPSYYYGYNTAYRYPAYGYQQPASQRQAAKKTESETAKPNSHVGKTKGNSGKKDGTDNSGRWLSDYNTAWAKAVEEGKPLVLLFVHHGCPECDRMDATLAQPGALQTLGSAIKARIEFTQNLATVQKFGVKLTPTFLVLSPAHNGEVYREVGALSIDRLRQLKPSIDSLVTAPKKSSETRQTKSVEKKSKNAAAPAVNPEAGNDSETSRTVAAI